MRKLFELALTGNYSVEKLTREAKILGIRSSKGGKPIVKSWMHRLLRDPFYTGRFVYSGKIHQGQHPVMITDAEFNLLQDILDGKSKGKLQKHDFALNGIIKCGECQYCITAQSHTKKYKNGKSQVFSYYSCTKKGDKKCNQPYLATSKLEGQFASELSLLEMDPEFVEIAYEALEEVKERDKNVNKGSFEALQTALDGINRRIDNLIALKISPDNSGGDLLSDAEFSDRKRVLMIEKDKIVQQLSQIDPNSNEWTEIAKDSFDFALLAYERFDKGDSEDKKVIFKAIGLNQILLDQNLQFQPRFIFLKLKKGIKTTNDEMSRLESEKRLSEQANLKNYLKSSVWCGGRDSN